MLISQGLALEDEQYVSNNTSFTRVTDSFYRHRLRFDARRIGSHAMDTQWTKLSDRSIRLQQRIEAWQEFQHMYMPGVAMLCACSDHEPGRTPVVATTMELMLPSQSIHCTQCDAMLIEDEWKLCVARASDLLHEVQQFLLIQHQLY